MAHYYEMTSNGVEPRHYVGVSSRPGELRPTRISDARKHGWHPSVTTVMGMLDKPALNDWRITEHLKTVFALGSLEGFSTLEDFCKVIKNKTQEALDKAPKDGTDFHDVLECWFKDTEDKEQFSEQQAAICANVELSLGLIDDVITPIHSEDSFTHEMGFAGKVDLHYSNWVVDFKTKNTKDKWKPRKMAYPEMAMQLAAYRVGLGLPNARCANVFICLEDGAVEFHEWDNAELDKQFANFSDLLRIWLRNAGYVPGSQQTGNS